MPNLRWLLCFQLKGGIPNYVNILAIYDWIYFVRIINFELTLLHKLVSISSRDLEIFKISSRCLETKICRDIAIPIWNQLMHAFV